MISVLIPSYNYDVSPLVHQLLKSAENANVQMEVIIRDDSPGSIHRESMSKAFAGLSNVLLECNQKNLGRSKCRNLLIDDAQFDNLLFLDADSELLYKDAFVSKYLENIKEHTVVVGGTRYQTEKPANKSLELHWKFGSKREALDAQRRSQHPYRYFFSNNFAASRNIFRNIRFDEAIVGYGYEDNLWAAGLEAMSIPVIHIDNPVLHLGLKDTNRFLSDVDQACYELSRLVKTGKKMNVRLWNMYKLLIGNFAGRSMLTLIYNKKQYLRTRLKNEDACLRYLDFYKLAKLHEYYSITG
jgi:glycosyltransferase involved in cell wall biosynthesis